MPKICKIDECGGRAIARGLCDAHYRRWKRHGDPLGGRTSPGEPETFYRDGITNATPDTCIEWPFSKSGRGYGAVYVDGVNTLVHRRSCEEVNGTPPTDEHQAAHNCGNRACFNPYHLAWKTQIENEIDKIQHGTVARGERQGSAKLTASDVERIRSLEGTMTRVEIAGQFGVSDTTIRDILKGRRWGWLGADNV